MAIDIDFEGSVDTKGYQLAHGRIIGNGGARRSYRLKDYPPIYSMFAKIKQPKELLEFVNKYGRLTPDDAGDRGDKVKDILWNAEMISYALETLQGQIGNLPRWSGGRFEYKLPKSGGKVSGGIPLKGKLTASLAPDPVTGVWQLRLQPPSLLDAIWLQFGQAITSNADLKSCDQCGKWFEAGAGSGRRADARFCSNKCRIEFNNQRRKQQ